MPRPQALISIPKPLPPAWNEPASGIIATTTAPSTAIMIATATVVVKTIRARMSSPKPAEASRTKPRRGSGSGRVSPWTRATASVAPM